MTNDTKIARFPNFLGIGVQKGGTTTLHQLLNKHPEIYLPPEKEIQFFSKHFERSKDWYAKHFAKANETQICGEITPYYIYHSKAAKRIATILPDVKLIILLRNPVERTLSQYFHAKRLGYEKLELHDALKAEEERLKNYDAFSYQKHSYVSRSKYYEQIERYKRYFKYSQMLILKSETFFKETEESWDRITGFLGVSRNQLPNKKIRANKGNGEIEHIDPKIKIWIQEKLESDMGRLRKFGITWENNE